MITVKIKGENITICREGLEPLTCKISELNFEKTSFGNWVFRHIMLSDEELAKLRTKIDEYLKKQIKDIDILYEDDLVVITVRGNVARKHWKDVLFKELGDGTWKFADTIITQDEKDFIQASIYNHYNWTGNQLYTINGLIVGNECKEVLRSEEYHIKKLKEEVGEFLEEIGKESFDKEHAIEEGWDVFTAMSNLLALRGVDVREFMDGFNKATDKKVNRGFLFE